MQSEKKWTQKSEQQRGNLQSLLDYLTHMKLTTSVQRNLLLLESLQEPRGAGQRATKPEEFVRVYDILLQVCAYYHLYLAASSMLSISTAPF